MVRRSDTPRDKIIEKGLYVSHGLQVDEFSLKEHQDSLYFRNLKLLNYEEAIKIHGIEEANVYFRVGI